MYQLSYHCSVTCFQSVETHYQNKVWLWGASAALCSIGIPPLGMSQAHTYWPFSKLLESSVFVVRWYMSKRVSGIHNKSTQRSWPLTLLGIFVLTEKRGCSKIGDKINTGAKYREDVQIKWFVSSLPAKANTLYKAVFEAHVVYVIRQSWYEHYEKVGILSFQAYKYKFFASCTMWSNKVSSEELVNIHCECQTMTSTSQCHQSL